MLKFKLVKWDILLVFKHHNHKEDLIMSENQSDEYGNTPKQLPNNQYNFGENTCVITYIENGKVKYFKYPNMKKKEL